MERIGEITLLILGTALLTMFAVYLLENGPPTWQSLSLISLLVVGQFCLTCGILQVLGHKGPRFIPR